MARGHQEGTMRDTQTQLMETHLAVADVADADAAEVAEEEGMLGKDRRA
jgi:hypothetical protein